MPRPRARKRRLNSLQPLPHGPRMHVLSLRACSGEQIQCQLFAASDDQVSCGIMHEPTHTAEVDDLPREWPVDGGDACNSAKLACGHVFHAAALALHFLVSDMRCPVCRAGVCDRLDIECVPAAIRAAYAAKADSVRKAEIAPQELEALRDDIRYVLTDLEVVFAVLGSGNGAPPRTTARTRVVWNAEHLQTIEQQVVSSAGESSEFAVQRSFQRLVRGIVGRQLEHNPAGCVRFSLQHPLVPVTIASESISVADAWNGFFNTIPEQASTCEHTSLNEPETILLYCPPVAGVNPVGALKATYHFESAAPRITAQINTLMLVNIASYVRQVLDSIRDAVEHHTSFDTTDVVEVTQDAVNGVQFSSMLSH